MKPASSILRPVIKVEKDKCVACHQCVQVCPVKFCNDASGDHVAIRPELCIGCGTCLDVCTHGARTGLDDFDEFMSAVSAGVRIVAIAAPAVASNFPEEYLHLNGWLRSLGVQAVFDVSFGAELTVRSYLEAIRTKKPKCVIAQPCAALVSYIEIYRPELLQHLAPADSPMLHTMKMIREFYPRYSSAKFVVLSPCYAKRREFDETGMGDFNVTYRSLDAHFKAKSINLRACPKVEYDNPPAERAVLFSSPGGLLRTAMREAPGIDRKSRKIEGVPFVYHYLSHLNDAIGRNNAPLLVDCLSCEIGATATQVDRQMNEAIANASSVASAAEKLSTTAAELSRSTGEVRQMTENASRKINAFSVIIKELGSSAEEVTKITESVSDIADRTNLLALNAAIEAARAGDAGRGFAVVADEVKKLALQAATSTDDIARRIEAIRSSTAQTIVDMDGITTIMAETSLSVGTIADSIKEQASVTETVAAKIISVTDSVNSVKEHVESMSNNIRTVVSSFGNE